MSANIDNPAEIAAADVANIERAAAVLQHGGLVAFPTETVYGLGADATDDRAVAAVFAAKDRPRFNPMIVHVADTVAARRIGRFNDRAEALAARFWPGALTMVLPRTTDCPVSRLVSAGLETVAVRVPDHAVAAALLAAAGCPIAAPSANRSGAISPTTAEHVRTSLPGPEGGGPTLILDGGRCPVGLESAVVDLSEQRPALLRPGGIAVEDLETVVGPLDNPTQTAGALKSPGLLERHYAPDTPLRLGAAEARPGEALLGFGTGAPGATLNLSRSGDLAEAAANLFAMLHDLDRQGHAAIAVMPVPDAGLGRAINDRLRRAATASE